MKFLLTLVLLGGVASSSAAEEGGKKGGHQRTRSGVEVLDESARAGGFSAPHKDLRKEKKGRPGAVVVGNGKYNPSPLRRGSVVSAHDDDEASDVGQRGPCLITFEFPKCTNLRALDLADQPQKESKLKRKLFRSGGDYDPKLSRRLVEALKTEANTNCLVPHRLSVRLSTRSAAQTPVSFAIRGGQEKFDKEVEKRTVFGVCALYKGFCF